MPKKSDELPRIPILDLSHSAFQHLNGNTPELVRQGTRVTFLFKPDETFYRLSALYNENSPVKILDFVHALRELKAMMLTLKNGGTRC
jgi:hypothetical protein